MSAHTLKRMRALQYTSLHSVRRPPLPMDEEADALHRRWSWLQEWVGALPSFDKDVPMEHMSAYSRDTAAAAMQLRLRAFFLAPVPDAAIGSILLGTAGDVASTDQCKLEEARTRDIVVDAVAIEHKFIHDAFPVALVSMTACSWRSGCRS